MLSNFSRKKERERKKEGGEKKEKEGERERGRRGGRRKERKRRRERIFVLVPACVSVRRHQKTGQPFKINHGPVTASLFFFLLLSFFFSLSSFFFYLHQFLLSLSLWKEENYLFLLLLLPILPSQTGVAVREEETNERKKDIFQFCKRGGRKKRKI